MGTLVEAELELVPPRAKCSFSKPDTSFVCSPHLCTSSAPRAESPHVTHSFPPSASSITFSTPTHIHEPRPPHQSPSFLLFHTHSCRAILRAPNTDTTTPPLMTAHLLSPALLFSKCHSAPVFPWVSFSVTQRQSPSLWSSVISSTLTGRRVKQSPGDAHSFQACTLKARSKLWLQNILASPDLWCFCWRRCNALAKEAPGY